MKSKVQFRNNYFLEPKNEPIQQKSKMILEQNENEEKTAFQIEKIEPTKSVSEKGRRRRKSTRSEEYVCSQCNTKDKNKFLCCYICKTLKCKNCSEKDRNYSIRKRDQSSFICPECFENQKIRYVYLINY